MGMSRYEPFSEDIPVLPKQIRQTSKHIRSIPREIGRDSSIAVSDGTKDPISNTTDNHTADEAEHWVVDDPRCFHIPNTEVQSPTSATQPGRREAIGIHIVNIAVFLDTVAI